MQISRGVIPRALKVVVYGPEGIGKTTFASRFPNPVFSDIEGGTCHMDVARLPSPTSWSMLLEQARYIRDNPGVCESWIIDTADWAERLCITHICARDQKDGLEGWGYGKGFQYLAEEYAKLLDLLEEVVKAGVNVVLNAHAHMRKFEEPDEMGSYDRWELKLQKKTAPLVKEWADMVLFARYKTYVVNVDDQGAKKGKNKAQGGARVMCTTHHPCWDAKNRQGLADELPFDFAQIAHCFSGAQPAPAPTAPESPAAPPAAPEPTPEPAPAPEPTPEAPAAEPAIPPEQQQLGVMSWPPKGATLPPSAPPEPPPPSGPPPGSEGLPKALQDLMAANHVTVKEIQEAVGFKGYYPRNTPVENYAPDFVQGVLIAAWDQVFKVIENDIRDLPF